MRDTVDLGMLEDSRMGWEERPDIFFEGGRSSFATWKNSERTPDLRVVDLYKEGF